MLLTWSADGGLAPVQLSKQKNRPGSHTAQKKKKKKCIGCLMGRVDAPTEAEGAEAGEDCPGSFETAWESFRLCLFTNT